MKWLLISDDDKELLTLKKSIENKYSTSEIITSSSDLKLETLINDTDVITHAVILSSFTKNTNISFLSGFLFGSACKIYALENIFSDLFLNSGCLQLFESFDALLSFLENQNQEILDENNKEEAYDFLYENGYPFDTDNFALYLSKWKKKICEAYFSAGMSLNSCDSEGTPMLNVAVRSDNFTAVKWLVSNGADINVVSKDRGYTPVMDAVWTGNEEITRFFIKKGAELNTISKEGQTMLILAVGANRTEIVKMLAENGADPDIADGMGMSAYSYAALFKKTEILAILEKYHKE